MLASFPEAEKLSFFGPLVWLRFRAIWWSLYVFFQSCQNFLGCYWTVDLQLLQYITGLVSNLNKGQTVATPAIDQKRSEKKGLDLNDFYLKQMRFAVLDLLTSEYLTRILSCLQFLQKPTQNIPNFALASKKWLNQKSKSTSLC